ncbi:MAG: TolB family protein [Candidatus Wenzhouxiangella sp. M2_3B_020]
MMPDPVGQYLRAALLALAAAACSTGNAQIERISVADDEAQANADSYQASISDDGSVVAFRSNADNLITGDTNDWTDVFLRDMDTGTTARISLQPDGSETPAYSMAPSISDDGNTVAFESRVQMNKVTLTAVFDATTGTVEQLLPREVSGNPASRHKGRLLPSLSGNGQFVAFHSKSPFQDAYPASVRPPNDDANGTFDVFVFDIATDPAPPLERVSRDSSGDGGRGESASATLSDDGNVVAFHSYADDLVADDLNGHEDAFVRFRNAGSSTLMVSVTPAGIPGNGDSLRPFVSGNGDFVAFRSQASDLVAGDTNGHWDIFVRDLTTDTTERVSVASDGNQAEHDSFEPGLSDDGRFVVFRSMAANLVAGDTNARADVFVHDRTTGETIRVSGPATGESDGHSYNPVISGDGGWIAFESDATNLVPGDTNAARDVFRVANPLAGGQ